MNPTTATPAEIDTVWLPLTERIARIENWIAADRKRINDPDTMSYYRDRAKETLAAHQAELAEAEREAEPFEREWNKRGGWTRYYLVKNGDGHYHATRACSTCFATTEFGINPMTSGLTERELVDLVGTDACTVCFPWAPTTPAWREGRSLGKAEKDARRDAKTVARVQKAEKKVAFWEKSLERNRAKMVKAGGNPDFTGEPVDAYSSWTIVNGEHVFNEEGSNRYYIACDIKEARDSLRRAQRELETAGEPVRQRGAYRERPAWTGRPR